MQQGVVVLLRLARALAALLTGLLDVLGLVVLKPGKRKRRTAFAKLVAPPLPPLGRLVRPPLPPRGLLLPRSPWHHL